MIMAKMTDQLRKLVNGELTYASTIELDESFGTLRVKNKPNPVMLQLLFEALQGLF